VQSDERRANLIDELRDRAYSHFWCSFKDQLRNRLLDWQKEQIKQCHTQAYFSALTLFPPKQLEQFVSHSTRYLSEKEITSRLLRKLVPWDSATELDLVAIASIISE
jgi:hypothetical protein